MIICNINKFPHLIEEAKQLHREEWKYEWTDTDETFVCISRGVLVGTVQFAVSDLPSHTHLTPWLSCVYVKEFYRNRGVSKKLVSYLENYAKNLGVDTLYLFTHDAENLYKKLGWEEFDQSVYKGDVVTVMRKRLI